MLSLLCVCCRDLILTAQSAARTRRGTQKCRASATAEQATCKTTNSSSGEVYCAPCHPSCSSCTTLTNQGCSACTLPLARSVPTNPTSSCEMVTTLPKFFDSLLGLDNFCHPMCLDCTTANTTHFCGGCIANADKNSTYCRCKPGFFLFESSGLTCLNCHDSCKECRGGGEYNCTACHTNARLQPDGSCKCRRGYYHSSPGICSAITTPKCKLASNSSTETCIQCVNNLVAPTCNSCNGTNNIYRPDFYALLVMVCV
jgi:proprotein convertase subtilisin/kexin type 5